MKRRDFITLLGGAAAAWPLGARAQQPAVPVVGFLATAGADLRVASARAFRLGLRETGFIEGQNVLIEDRAANGRYDRLTAMADELIRKPVSVLVTGGIPATLAAKASGTTISVVFYMGGDPIELGLIHSLSRPGGNFTGVTNLNTELGPKRLELLHGLVPAATSFALLVNPANRNAESQWRDMEAAAHALGLQMHLVRAKSESDFDGVFVTITQLRTGGLVIGADGVFVSRSQELAGLAFRHRVPAIFQFREFAAAGGLVSYGGSLSDAYRQVGIYTGRVLNGEKPADLPVQQTTKVEMIINLATARALGITVPLPLLGRADEVIE
jgi:putative tryptophan/tyrosine transport system substrate-binding protein